VATEKRRSAAVSTVVNNLNDVLAARCADLDRFADPFIAPDQQLKFPGPVVQLSGNTMIALLQDPAPDNDRISLRIRSCTFSSLEVVRDEELVDNPKRVDVNVEVPNIVEFEVTALNGGTGAVAPGKSPTATGRVFFGPGANDKFEFDLPVGQKKTEQVLIVHDKVAAGKPKQRK
jgi:hypothetical protein